MSTELTGEAPYFGVRVSEAALVQLCQAGLEAYSVPGQVGKGAKRKRLLETYGQLWGHRIQLAEDHVLYAVEMVTIDTTALRDTTSADAWVQPNSQALDLKVQLMGAFWHKWQLVGNFHSYPYKSAKDAAAASGDWFSDQDITWIESSKQFRENDYRVGLVLTIAQMKNRLQPNPDWIEDYTAIRFTLSNYRFWLKAYMAYPDGKRFKLSEHVDTDRYIECPSLVGMRYPYAQFGKGGDKNIYVPALKAR